MKHILSLGIIILGIIVFRSCVKGLYTLLGVFFPALNGVVAVALAVGIIFALFALAIVALKRK